MTANDNDCNLGLGLHPQTVATIFASKDEWVVIFYTSVRKYWPALDKLEEWIKTHGCSVDDDYQATLTVTPNPNYCQEELFNNFCDCLCFWMSVGTSKLNVSKSQDFYLSQNQAE